MNAQEIYKLTKNIHQEYNHKINSLEDEFNISSKEMSQIINKRTGLILELISVITENSIDLTEINENGKTLENKRIKREEQRRLTKENKKKAEELTLNLLRQKETLNHEIGILNESISKYQQQAENKVSETYGSNFIKEYKGNQQTLMNAAEKLEIAKKDAEAKKPKFENDPFFSYLLKQNFGQSTYNANFLVAIFDRVLAKYCHFDRNYEIYKKFMGVPNMIEGHLQNARQKMIPLKDKYEKFVNGTLNKNLEYKTLNYQLKDLLEDDEKLQKKLDAALLEESLKEQELSLFNTGKDRYAIEISKFINNLIENKKDDIELIVNSSNTQKDNILWGSIQEMEKETKNIIEKSENQKKELSGLKDEKRKVEYFLAQIERRGMEKIVDEFNDPSEIISLINSKKWDKLI